MMHLCPVCLNETLQRPPYDSRGVGSDEICPACGFQFGSDDFLHAEFNRARWRLYRRYIHLKEDINTSDSFDFAKYVDIQRKVRISDTAFTDMNLVKRFFVPNMSLENCEIEWDVLNECYKNAWLTDRQVIEYCSSYIDMHETDYDNLIVGIAFGNHTDSESISNNLNKLALTVQCEETLRRRLASFVCSQLLNGGDDFYEKYSELVDFLIVFEDCYNGDVFSILTKSDFPSKMCYNELLGLCSEFGT